MGGLSEAGIVDTGSVAGEMWAELGYVEEQVDVLEDPYDSDSYLTFNDANQLSSLEAGANGIAVDEDGEVFVTINSGSGHKLVHWNGAYGAGNNYEVIAGSSDPYVWFGPLEISGRFYDPNDPAPLYGSYTFYGPVTKITYTGN